MLSLDPSDHSHLGSPKYKVRHQEIEEMILGTPEEAFQYRTRSTGIFLCPEVSLLELLGRHLLWFEDDVAHVIVGPVTVDDPILLLHSLEKRGSWKRGEDGKGWKFDIVLLDKLNGFLEYPRIVSIEPKNKRPVDTNLMALNDPDQIG
jgi:hypothetical protein